MRFITPLLLLFVISSASLAADVRYISDKQFVPLRSGAGKDYRITHRGIPSGTRLTVTRTAENGEWSEITTEKGTSGWIRSQYLMENVPARLQVNTALEQAKQASARSAELEAQLKALQTERSELLSEMDENDNSLDSVSSELQQLKQISGKAVALDADNRRLVVATENLRSEVEMLQAENLRLQDKLESEDFINGALAVLLGVIITLVAPRLIPKRRKNTGWA